MSTYDDIRAFEAFEQLMQEPPGPTWRQSDVDLSTPLLEWGFTTDEGLLPTRPVRRSGAPWFDQLDPTQIPIHSDANEKIDPYRDGINARRQPEFIPGTHRRIRVSANGDEQVHIIIRVGTQKVMI